MPHPLGDELTELHVHLGGAVDPAAMWGIAHDQGIRLPTKDYWEFVDLITVRKQSKKSFEDFLALYHWTELIQSSPLAVEQSVYEVVGGAYRKANITTLELRYNPMKRNRGGERDLDHIINASIRGLDRALLDYPVKAGLIFCLDRTFDQTLNAILVEKAIAYRHRGVVGIDIAGGKNPDFHYRDYASLFKKARKAGLGVTVAWGLPYFEAYLPVLHQKSAYFPVGTKYPGYLPVDNRASNAAGKTVRAIIDAVQFPSDVPPAGFPGAPKLRLEGNQVAVLLRSDSLANVTAGAVSTAMTLLPLKGCSPVTIWYSTQPRLNRSQR